MSNSLATVAQATAERHRAQSDWEESLREAAKSHSLRQIAPLAGVTYGRVAQIVGPKNA